MTQNTTDRRLVGVVLLALALLLVVPALFMGVGMMGYGAWGSGMWGSGPMMGGWGDGAPGWVLVLGVVMQLAFLAVLVGGGYLLYRAVTAPTDGRDRALDELRAAYARGDLSDEEYERRRERLERDG